MDKLKAVLSAIVNSPAVRKAALALAGAVAVVVAQNMGFQVPFAPEAAPAPIVAPAH